MLCYCAYINTNILTDFMINKIVYKHAREDFVNVLGLKMHDTAN